MKTPTVGILLMALLGCVEGPADAAATPPPPLTERRSDTVVTGAPRALGEDCAQGLGAACASGVCLKMGHGPGQAATWFCSRECRTEAQCPADWLCVQGLPGPHGFVCLAQSGWLAHPVAVRP